MTDPRLASGTPVTFRVRLGEMLTECGDVDPRSIRTLKALGRELRRLTPLGVDAAGFSVYAVEGSAKLKRAARVCRHCGMAP